jgi:hypothetical protein
MSFQPFIPPVDKKAHGSAEESSLQTFCRKNLDLQLLEVLKVCEGQALRDSQLIKATSNRCWQVVLDTNISSIFPCILQSA